MKGKPMAEQEADSFKVEVPIMKKQGENSETTTSNEAAVTLVCLICRLIEQY